MCTPVYIKMDVVDQLLLAEGVCRQLGIVSYHADVEDSRGGSKQGETHLDKTGTVPVVRVQSVRVLPYQSVLGTIQIDNELKASAPLLLQPELSGVGSQVEESLLTVQDDGTARVSLVNLTGFTQTIDSGTSLGTLSEIYR